MPSNKQRKLRIYGGNNVLDQKKKNSLIKPGSVLLSHVLGRSTIGAGNFHFRVRDGIEWCITAMATGLDKGALSSVTVNVIEIR